MGSYLLTPLKDKDVHKGESAKLKFVSMGMQGWRNTQEDAHCQDIDIGGGMSFFCVMDGHGGNEVAEYIRDILVKTLKEQDSFKKGDYETAFKDTAKSLDDHLRTDAGKEGVSKYVLPHYPNTLMQTHKDAPFGIASQVGCTMTAVIITDKEIICGNIGDSRTIAAKLVGGKLTAEDLSVDHKPTLQSETERIVAAGGIVDKSGRIDGAIACARSIGDLQFKEKDKPHFECKVSCEPDIKRIPRNGDLKYIILGCDGIWDCKTSQEVVDWIDGKQKETPDLEKVMGDLVDDNLPPRAKGAGIDNMSLIVVQFK